MNLCPCGARGDPGAECSCSPQRLAAFRDKLSRALLDRFDLVVTVPRPRGVELAAGPSEASAAVRERVVRCARAAPRRACRAARRRPTSCSRARSSACRSPAAAAPASPASAQTIAALAGADEVAARARLRGALLPHAVGAAGASERARPRRLRGAHAIPTSSPSRASERFARFRREFDAARLPGRARAARPALGRRARRPASRAPLAAIFDTPAGLFVRGAGGARRSSTARRSPSSAPAPAPPTAPRSRSCSAASWPPPGSSSSAASRAASTAMRTGARSTPAGSPSAVLGCGIDRDYPAAHAELAARICEHGPRRLRVRAGRRARALALSRRATASSPAWPRRRSSSKRASGAAP